jgi:PAS domain S-box-containing protein
MPRKEERLREELPRLKHHLRIDESHDTILRRVGGAVSPEERARFVQGFYDHLDAVEELRPILAGADRIRRLQLSLGRYLDELLTAPIDDRYFQRRRQIGETHLKEGLLPRWNIGGYAFFVDWWLPRLCKESEQTATAQAFFKRILLDIILAMESYYTASVAGLTSDVKRLDRELKDGMHRLVLSERQYRDLVENAPVMIYQLDRDDHFIQMNRTGLNRLGYTLGELTGTSIEEIVPLPYRRGIRQHTEEVKSAGESHYESIFRTKVGREFPVEIFASAQYGTAGRLVRTRAFVRDLSETRHLEQELQKWERLAAVGSMAAKVAHEIRNPLSAISLNAELLQDEVVALPEEGRRTGEQILATILKQVDRLNTLIEEYLAFGRLPPLQRQPLSLGEVFHRLRQLIGPEMEERGIALSFQVDEALPSIAADSRQLEQIFLNLLKNAQDAMPEGGEIHVEARNLPEGIEVKVRDTGCGIPAESLPKIFDPLFTSKDSGTGLGLAYVHQVIREQEGTIACKSTVGEGTEFTLYFPHIGAAVAPEETPSP